MACLPTRYRSGVARAVPALADNGAAARTAGSPASTAAPADGSWRSCARTAARRACGSCRASPTCCRRRRRPRWSPSTCRSACRARVGIGGRAAENAVRPLLGARQSSVFSVPSRRGDLCRRLSRGLPRSRAATLRPAAQGVEAAIQHRAENPRGGRVPARRSGGGRAGVRGASRAGVLAAQRRPRADRTEEGQEPAATSPGSTLRRGLLMAAGLPDDVVNAVPPKGAAADDLLDALACAAVARRIHAGAWRSLSRSAAARRVRTADGDLGMRFARNCGHELSAAPDRRLRRLRRAAGCSPSRTATASSPSAARRPRSW